MFAPPPDVFVRETHRLLPVPSFLTSTVFIEIGEGRSVFPPESVVVANVANILSEVARFVIPSFTGQLKPVVTFAKIAPLDCDANVHEPTIRL